MNKFVNWRCGIQILLVLVYQQWIHFSMSLHCVFHQSWDSFRFTNVEHRLRRTYSGRGWNRCDGDISGHAEKCVSYQSFEGHDATTTSMWQARCQMLTRTCLLFWCTVIFLDKILAKYCIESDLVKSVVPSECRQPVVMSVCSGNTCIGAETSLFSHSNQIMWFVWALLKYYRYTRQCVADLWRTKISSVYAALHSCGCFVFKSWIKLIKLEENWGSCIFFQILPHLERFTKVTLWLDSKSENVAAYSRKLGESRCYIVNKYEMIGHCYLCI